MFIRVNHNFQFKKIELSFMNNLRNNEKIVHFIIRKFVELTKEIFV